MVQRHRFQAILLVGYLIPSIAYVLLPPAFKISSHAFYTCTSLAAVQKKGGNYSANSRNSYQDKSRKKMTIGDLKKQLINNPEIGGSPNEQNKRKKSRRTRKRAENPKQKYVYSSQRKKSHKEANEGDRNDSNNFINSKSPPIIEAKRVGLTNPANQHFDSLVNNVEPEILGEIRVDEGSESGASGAYAFLINKPAGWSILGEKRKAKSLQQKMSKPYSPPVNASKKRCSPNKSSNTKLEKLKNEGGDAYVLDEPEIRDGEVFAISSKLINGTTANSIPGWYEIENMSPHQRKEAGIEDEDYDPSDIPYFDETDVIALMSDEERELYEAEKKGQEKASSKTKNRKSGANTKQEYESFNEDGLTESGAENVKKIKARLLSKKDLLGSVSFSSFHRPSIVSWLKEKKAAEGNPIRGGKFWTALAGATDVDDSGVVLLCPKVNSKNLMVEYSEYVAVVGNNKFIAPKSKQTILIPDDALQLEMISRVRKGRDGDVAQTVRFVVSGHFTSCSSIISHAQTQFEDGIRGDPAANPFDRRAPRRLIHCNSMAVSSLVCDETVETETENFTDDIMILSDRLNGHKFQKGSFLGRQSLRDNPLTNAYREINGAADGFPGWIVDRYGDWLFVQHDDKEPRGPLPSIHDGNTAGVYLLPANPDRSSMGSRDRVRPVLLEGQPAPEVFPILENGVTYHVSLSKDLSTGIFLDQRANRAWLTRNCNEKTHVLNCFAHCGAFSVAAATAGASTVSLDLSKKWLDRVQPQLEANGVSFDERHDCIYGDCFEWLEKLRKRGEKFDIVILDPPSSSVGKKKKRWSVNRDMAELVQLAAPLVKEGGLLWTTTNSASLSPLKFTGLCRKGFEQAGIFSRLERIQPMSVDFPSIGSPPVKNLVWRIK